MNWPEDRSWVDLSVATYAALVRSGVGFAQSAYRDGEWYCMLGHRGRNVNGERYGPELGAALRRTLTEPAGQWCVFWWAHDSKGVAVRKQALKWLESNQPQVAWIPDRPIGRAMEIGRAAPFWRAVQHRRVVLVGPKHLQGQDLIHVSQHIVVPDGDAWRYVDNLLVQVRRAIEGEPPVVLFASGMASNLMIHALAAETRGTATVLYDIGAALDPYAGVYSRGEYATPKWRDTVKDRNRP